MSDNDFEEWKDAHLELWNSLIKANVGDMISFQITRDGHSTYEQFIIGQDKDGNYQFEGVTPSEPCNDDPCIRPNKAYRDSQTVLNHINNGSEWALYTPESYKYTDKTAPLAGDEFVTTSFAIKSHSNGYDIESSPYIISMRAHHPLPGSGPGMRMVPQLSADMSFATFISSAGAGIACIGSSGATCVASLGLVYLTVLHDTKYTPVYYP